ncbi:MAG: FeoC-like transcriptional regulator [Anaerolineales bacterium]|nr:FeoC-like transcriptional regulator [Anaerolineales bacterium]
MLERLLTEIRLGGTFETTALAARLGTTPELATAMLEHLQRMGRIRPYRTCGNACGGCNLRTECLQPQPGGAMANGVQLFMLADPLPDADGTKTSK